MLPVVLLAFMLDGKAELLIRLEFSTKQVCEQFRVDLSHELRAKYGSKFIAMCVDRGKKQK